MKVKTGGRKKGTPNKISSQIKEKLSQIIDETIDSLDISVMNSNQKIKGVTDFWKQGKNSPLLKARKTNEIKEYQ